MMKRYPVSAAIKSAIGVGVLSFALIGCGSDGEDGTDGEDGKVGIDIQQATSLNANILHARVTGGLVAVDFELMNANGVPVFGLEKFEDINTLGFGIAKLDGLQKRDPHAIGQPVAPEQYKGTKPSQWTSYINTMESANPEHVPQGYGHIAGDQIQANIESSCKTDCISVLDHGTYRYTFSKPLSEYDQIDALDTEFNPELTHRVTLELKPTSTFSSATLINTHYDFIPVLDRAAKADETRNLVDLQASCIRCHSDDYDSSASKLMMHGSKRIEIENCLVCHTTYSGDPETGATIDFGSMLHRIHDGTYLMAGYGGSIHDYTETTFPADIADCQTCHINEEHSPAQADNFQFHRQEACASCHMAQYNPVDNAQWLTPPGENKDRGFVGNYFHYYATPELDGVEGADVRGVFENQACSSCHADESNPLGSAKFHMAKANETLDVREQYAYTLSNGVISTDEATLKQSITFSLNWNQDLTPDEDPAVKALWLTAAAFEDEYQIDYISSIHGRHPGRFSIDLANIEKYSNVSLEKAEATLIYTISDLDHAGISATQQGFLSAKLFICAQTTSHDISPTDTIDCDTEEQSQSHVEVVVEGKQTSFSIDGADIDKRRVVVAAEKCAACHGEQADFSFSHSRVRESGAPDSSCSSCHTSEPNTAISLADGSCVQCHNDSLTAANSSGHSVSRAKDFSRGYDFKVMAHQIHANKRSGRYGDYTTEITFPGNAADCATCHDKGQLSLDGLANTHAFHANDGIFSPTVAACASCHAPSAEGNSSVISHFESNGGVYQGAEGSYQLGSESCATCHAEGKSIGVDKVHPTNY